MNMYEQSPLFSGTKGPAFAAVILLHLVFGWALYSELAGQIAKKFDPPPLNLTPITEPIKKTVKPPPGVPLIDQRRLYVTPPVLPPLTPPEPNAPVVTAPLDPQTMTPPIPPPPGANMNVRIDPKHPLRIGEAYYPDASRRANEMGRCVVKVTVAIDGRIIAATLQSSAGFDRLDQACLNGVRGQRMLPAVQDGKPIESTVSIPISWNLSEK
jgi:protein TonB